MFKGTQIFLCTLPTFEEKIWSQTPGFKPRNSFLKAQRFFIKIIRSGLIILVKTYQTKYIIKIVYILYSKL